MQCKTAPTTEIKLYPWCLKHSQNMRCTHKSIWNFSLEEHGVNHVLPIAHELLAPGS